LAEKSLGNISRNWPLGGDPSDAGRKWWALLLTSTTLFYCVLEDDFFS